MDFIYNFKSFCIWGVKMKSKLDSLAIVFIIWGILLIFLTMFVIIILSQDPVSFSIRLEKSNFTRGEDLILHYKVSNSWSKSISDIIIATEIENIGHKNESKYENVKIFNNLEGIYKLDTNKLNKGKYRILVDLSYIDKKGERQDKNLSLEFQVN